MLCSVHQPRLQPIEGLSTNTVIAKFEKKSSVCNTIEGLGKDFEKNQQVCLAPVVD